MALRAPRRRTVPPSVRSDAELCRRRSAKLCEAMAHLYREHTPEEKAAALANWLTPSPAQQRSLEFKGTE